MTPSVYLIWNQTSNTLIGNTLNGFVESPAVLGITFPNQNTTPINIQLSSSARDTQAFSTLTGVKFYLTGDSDQINIVQNVWPASGGGLQISFNGGQSYQTFTTTYGYQANPSTWVLLPASAVGLNGIDGTLGILDSASLSLQYIIPENATQYDIYNVALTCDFDVDGAPTGGYIFGGFDNSAFDSEAFDH